MLRGCCAGGAVAPEPLCCQRCPKGLSLSLPPFMVATAPVSRSTVSPTSPTNVDPAMCHPGVVMLLEVAVILPAGLHTSSSPCRRPAQAEPAPLPPRTLLSTASHPCFILPGDVQPPHLLPGRLPRQIRAPAPAPGPSPCGGHRPWRNAIPSCPPWSICPSLATNMAVHLAKLLSLHPWLHPAETAPRHSDPRTTAKRGVH